MVTIVLLEFMTVWHGRYRTNADILHGIVYLVNRQFLTGMDSRFRGNDNLGLWVTAVLPLLHTQNQLAPPPAPNVWT